VQGFGRTCLIDPSTDKRWDSFVENHPHGTLYHLSCWEEVLERTFGYTPLYYVLEDAKGNISGGIPMFSIRSFATGNRLVSLPFSDYCNILVESENEFAFLLSSIRNSACARTSNFIRFCLTDSDIDLRAHGFQQERQFKNHILPIDGPSDVIKNTVIHASRRNTIRQALKLGVSIAYSAGGHDLVDYYHMYVQTRKKHGLVPLPFGFFKNVWAVLQPKRMAYLALAKVKGKTVAGSLFLRDRSTLYVLSNASLKDFLRYRPNDLLWWEAIDLAAREKLKTVDFGRTSVDNVGLLAFKREWGPIERDISHYALPLRTSGHEGAGLASNRTLRGLIRFMPNPLLRLCGKLMYRHVG
jgi:predicted N-acyltransferase